MEPERPIGYWLRHLDNLLEAQLEGTLAGHGLVRRQWQVLHSLARRPRTCGELAQALAPCRRPGEPAVEPLLDELTGRGWISRARGADLVSLTEQGRAVHRELTREVQRTRVLVLNGVTPDQYSDTVRTLASLARNVEHALAEGRGGPA